MELFNNLFVWDRSQFFATANAAIVDVERQRRKSFSWKGRSVA